MPGVIHDPDDARNPREPIVLHWPEFQQMFFDSHRQGEHVSIVGPNGSGKTLVGLELCKLVGLRRGKDRRPSRVVVLQYKPRDDTLRQVLPESDWPIIKKWPPSYGQEHCIVWPRGGPPSTAARKQRAVFAPLLDELYSEGSQTVMIPEAAYFERTPPNGLGLGGTMEQFWSTARSLKLSVISDTQRPCHVTRLMWSEPAWVFIFRLDDEEDIKRVAKLSGDPIGVFASHGRLGEHEFLCVRRQRHAGERALYVSRVDVVTSNNRNKE